MNCELNVPRRTTHLAESKRRFFDAFTRWMPLSNCFRSGSVQVSGPVTDPGIPSTGRGGIESVVKARLRLESSLGNPGMALFKGAPVAEQDASSVFTLMMAE